MKRIHKTLAMLLCISIFSSILFCVPVAAAEAVPPTYKADIPYIHVTGLMTSDIYENPDNPKSDTVWPPEAKTIIPAVLKLIPALWKLSKTKNYEAFGDRLVPILNSVFGPARLNPDGTAHDQSGARQEWYTKEQIEEYDSLSFDYDWRTDPIVIAEQLNEFINYVLEQSGADQVVLESHSFGGVVSYTYAKMYGTEKVRSFLFNASAIYGETFTAEMCRGEMTLSPEGLTEYLKAVTDHEKGEKLLNGILAFLLKSGFTGGLCNSINRILENLHDRIFTEVIMPMFGNWPSIWAMVPDDEFETAYNHVMTTFFADDGIDHMAMQDRILRFRTEVADHKAEILNQINDKANLYVVARHGYCSLFCTPSWRVANDMIVDVRYSSFGATVAPYGETLPAEYLDGRNAEYINPSRTIDASTCLFPDRTWFVADYMHMHSRVPGDLFATLLYSPTQATVDTFPEYPQFMRYTDNDALIPE